MTLHGDASTVSMEAYFSGDAFDIYMTGLTEGLTSLTQWCVRLTSRACQRGRRNAVNCRQTGENEMTDFGGEEGCGGRVGPTFTRGGRGRGLVS